MKGRVAIRTVLPLRPQPGASPEIVGRMGVINRIQGAVRNPMGRKKPEGLIHTLAQGERSVALGKDVHCANPERVQHRGTQEGKGRNLLCPFRARRIINRLPRAALRLPWASACGILSGFFRTRIFRFLSWVSRCRTEPGYSNFSKPSREFGGCTPAGGEDLKKFDFLESFKYEAEDNMMVVAFPV